MQLYVPKIRVLDVFYTLARGMIWEGFSPAFLSLNVQKLNMKKISELEIFSDEISSVKFLCLNETCLNENAIDQLTISGFELVTYYCWSIKNGGGTAVRTRTNINVEQINLQQCSVEGHCEMCAVSFRS